MILYLTYFDEKNPPLITLKLFIKIKYIICNYFLINNLLKNYLWHMIEIFYKLSSIYEGFIFLHSNFKFKELLKLKNGSF